jgi:acyl carrier protein
MIAMMPALDSQPLTSCPKPDGLTEISVHRFYGELEDQGVVLGPSCQGLMRLWIGNGHALGMLKPVSENARYELPLTWIDSAFQLLTALLPQNAPRDFIFTGLGNFQIFGPVETSQPGYCDAVGTSTHSETLTGDLRLFDSTGRMVVLVKNARLERAAAFTAPKKAPAYSVDPILDELHVALPEEQHNVMVCYLVRVLAQTLRKQPQELDIDIPLIGMLDSLMAVELKLRIETDLRVEVPVAAIFEGDSIRELGRYLLKDMLVVKESVAEMIRDLESLSDSEVEAMLKMERGESNG